MQVVLSMFFVILYMIILFYFMNRSRRYSSKSQSKILILFIVVMLLFMLFKKLGLDYMVYTDWFANLDTNYNITSSRIEPIPFLLMAIPKMFSLPANIFFFLIGGITLYLNYRIIALHSPLKIVSLFFLFFLFLFSGFSDAIRQALAASFFLYSMHFIAKRFFLKAFVMVSLSVATHYSSFIVIIALILSTIKWTAINYILSIILTLILFYVLKVGIVEWSNNLDTTNRILWSLDYYMNHYVELYQYQNSLHKNLSNIMTFMPFFGHVFINLVFLIRYNKIYVDDFYSLLLKINIIGTIIFAAFWMLDAKIIGSRILLTLNFSAYLLITFIILKSKINSNISYFILSYWLLYNFIIILYYMGIFSVDSIFYIYELF